MTDPGRAKAEEAKRNGQWYAPSPMAVTEEQIAGRDKRLAWMVDRLDRNLKPM